MGRCRVKVYWGHRLTILKLIDREAKRSVVKLNCRNPRNSTVEYINLLKDYLRSFDKRLHIIRQQFIANKRIFIFFLIGKVDKWMKKFLWTFLKLFIYSQRYIYIVIENIYIYKYNNKQACVSYLARRIDFHIYNFYKFTQFFKNNNFVELNKRSNLFVFEWLQQ